MQVANIFKPEIFQPFENVNDKAAIILRHREGDAILLCFIRISEMARGFTRFPVVGFRYILYLPCDVPTVSDDIDRVDARSEMDVRRVHPD
jgi:hypothetical protein